MIAHVVFDCDGVLVDSEPLSMEVDQELLAEHGLKLPRSEVDRLFMGHAFSELVHVVARDYGVILPDDISAQKDRRLFKRFEDELQAVAGAAAAMERLRLPRSVASNSTRERVALSLKLTGLAEHFGGRITTFEDVARGKPEPDVYLLAAKRAGARPERCLAVEDSVTGATAARRAGLKVVGFTGACHDADAQAKLLRAAGAEIIVAHMDDLEGAIKVTANL